MLAKKVFKYLNKNKQELGNESPTPGISTPEANIEENEIHDDSGSDGSGAMFCQIKNGEEYPIDLRNLYKNSGCFFIAGGPSFKDVDKSLLQKAGVLTLGVNNSPKSFRPNLWVAVDEPARFLESIWRDPKIFKFCGMGKWKKPIWDHNKWTYNDTLVQECPNVIHFRRNNRFNAATYLTENTVNWGNHKDLGGGRSCMVAALKIMWVLGIRRVYLLGVDFKMTGNYTYHFKEQRANGAVKGNNSTYLRMLSYFTQLSPYFEKSGFKIYNCTNGSHLYYIPHMDLKEAIDIETSKIPDTEKEETMNMYTPGK